MQCSTKKRRNNGKRWDSKKGRQVLEPAFHWRALSCWKQLNEAWVRLTFLEDHFNNSIEIWLLFQGCCSFPCKRWCNWTRLVAEEVNGHISIELERLPWNHSLVLHKLPNGHHKPWFSTTLHEYSWFPQK